MRLAIAQLTTNPGADTPHSEIATVLASHEGLMLALRSTADGTISLRGAGEILRRFRGRTFAIETSGFSRRENTRKEKS